MFYEIQKNKKGNYIYRERRNISFNQLICIHISKITCDYVRQWCKTNRTIKRYNRLKSEHLHTHTHTHMHIYTFMYIFHQE